MDSLEFSIDEATYYSLVNEKRKSGFGNKTWDEWFQHTFEFRPKSQKEKMENTANKFFYDKNFDYFGQDEDQNMSSEE